MIARLWMDRVAVHVRTIWLSPKYVHNGDCYAMIEIQDQVWIIVVTAAERMVNDDLKIYYHYARGRALHA